MSESVAKVLMGVDPGSVSIIEKDLLNILQTVESSGKLKVKVDIVVDNNKIKSVQAQLMQLKNIMRTEGNQISAISNASDVMGNGKISTRSINAQAKAFQNLTAQMEAAMQAARQLSDAGISVSNTFGTVASGAKNAEDQIETLNTGTQEYAKIQKQIASLMSQGSRAMTWTAAKKGTTSGEYMHIQQLNAELAEYEAKLRSGILTQEEAAQGISRIKAEMASATTAIRGAGEATGSFTSRVTNLAQQFGTWFSIYRVIIATIRVVKQMISNVRELESSMAQLKIITGATDTQMSNFLKNATVLARDLGQSITDVLSSIETFSRLGYNLPDATELAKYANILSNVANTDTKTATTGLTSIMKGYGMEVSNAEHIADVLISVGQKYAISAEELMTAFERGGAALHATGTSFEESAALFAATNAALQNAETTGTMWKTVSARIRRATTELEEMGESTEDVAEGLSKYRKEIEALSSVDIMEDENTYKSIYQIFVELAKVWDSIDNEQSQARIAEILGGTRQYSGIMSTITNIKDAMGAYESALDSAGTATEANSIYMETADAKLKQFHVTFQEFSQSVISSGFISWIVTAGDKLLRFLTILNKLPFGTTTLIAFTTLLVNNLLNISKMTASLTTVSSLVGAQSANVVQYTEAVKGLSKVQAVAVMRQAGANSANMAATLLLRQCSTATKQLTVDELSETLAKVGVSEASKNQVIQNLKNATTQELVKKGYIQLTAAEIANLVATEVLSDEQGKLLLTLQGLIAHNAGASASFGLLTKAIWENIAAFAKWLVTTPAGWITLVIGGIAALAIWSTKYEGALESSKKKLAALTEENNELTSKITDVNSELKETQNLISDLQSKGTLSFTDKEELERLRKQRDELQRTVDLLELEKKLKQTDVNKAFVETMEQDIEAPREYRRYQNVDDQGNEHWTFTGAFQPTQGTDEEFADEEFYIEQQLKNYQRYLDALDKLDEEYKDDLENKDYQNSRQWYEDRLEQLRKYFLDKNTEFKTVSEGVEYIRDPQTEDERKVNEWLDFINDFQDKMAIAMGDKNAKTNAFNRIVNNWKFDDTVQELQDLGAEGKVTADMLNDSKYSDFINKLVEIGVIDSADNLEDIADAFNNSGEAANNASESVDKAAVSLKKLSDLSNNISSISSTIKEFSDNGYITIGTLEKLKEATGLSGDAWSEYQSKLLSGSLSANELSSIMSELTIKMIDNKFAGAELTDQTEEEIAAILRENGVINANAVAHDYVRLARVNETIAAYDGTQASYDSATALINESLSAEEAKVALAQLELAKLNVNKVTISSSADIDNIIAIANAAHATIKTLSDLARAKAELQPYFVGPKSPTTTDIANGTYNYEYDKLDPNDFKVGSPRYGGSRRKSGGSGSDKGKKEVEEYIAEIEKFREAQQKLTDAERKRDAIEREINRTQNINEQLLLQRNLTEAYEEQQKALHNLNEERRSYLRERVDYYRDLGFEIEYDEETNRLVIRNLEHINELVASSSEGYESLQEATNAFRKETEEGLKEVEKINEDSQKSSEEWAKTLETLIKENRERLLNAVEATQKEYDEYKDSIDKVNKELDEQIKKQEAIKKITEKQYDAVNKLTETQHEMDKSIADSRISKEYLNESEYAKIFNEEDYRRVSRAIKSVGNSVDALTDRFRKQVLDAYQNEQTYLIENITAEYERQLELKMREIEIVKAELDYTKKQTELNNILSERNIKQIVERNGKFQFEWVADQDKVRSATEALADAEYNLKKLSDQKTQQLALDDFERQVDALKAIQDENNDNVKKFGETVNAVKKEIDNLKDPVMSFRNAVAIIQSQGIVSLGEAVNDMIVSIGRFTGTYHNTVTIPNGISVNVNPDGKAPSGLSVGTTVKTAGGNYLITGVNADGTYRSAKLTGYANGTTNASRGWHEVEEGHKAETYVSKDGIFHNFSGGEYVFNSEQTRKLWDLSKQLTKSPLDIYRSIKSDIKNVIPFGNNQLSNKNYSFGDIIIQNPADFDSFVRQLTNRIKERTV